MQQVKSYINCTVSVTFLRYEILFGIKCHVTHPRGIRVSPVHSHSGKLVSAFTFSTKLRLICLYFHMSSSFPERGEDNTRL